MFGRNKHDDEASAPAPTVPALDNMDTMLVMSDHLMAAHQLEVALAEAGGTGTATVTAADLVLEALAGTEYSVTAEIDPDTGDPFDATFTVFRQAGQHPPAAGDNYKVVFDPADPTRVAKVPDLQAGQVPETLWVLPDHCPECGAVVDQSVQSKAAHPSCPFCQNPLPCHR